MIARNGIEIRIWMIRNRIRMKEVGRETGMENSYIYRTIFGSRNCRKVLRYLLEKGCPAELLALPEDMKEAA